MTEISAQIKVFAKVDWSNLAQSKVQLQAMKNKKWVPLFEFALSDVAKFYIKTKRRTK